MIEKVCYMNALIAEELEPQSNEALISISDPGEYRNLSKNWEHLLRMSFYDLDAPLPGFLEVFDSHHARIIIGWLEQLPEEVDTLYVNCNAGISRSAAVAKFIAGLYGVPFNEKYSLYNKRVYSTLCTTYRDVVFKE